MKKTTLAQHISSIVATMALLTLPAQSAMAEGQQGGGDGFASLIPLVLIMVIFWFLLIRPQQKRLKQHSEMIQAIKKGDEVITAGGVFGKVMDVKDTFVRVEIAEGVRVKVKQDTIQTLITADNKNT